ncbi:WAT1-related protein At3g30340-like [Carya illinoinensis]|nr:WAT1-related protein At3g30340-like [Carya illinoinensis]
MCWGVVKTGRKFVKRHSKSLTLPPNLPSFPVECCIDIAIMKSFEEWKPFIVMIAVNFSFAIVNILLKKVLDQGMNHLVLVTYRLSISTMFLAPIGYYMERNSRPKLTLRILCYLFFSAIIGASITQYFFLLGIQYTSATFACAFVNMVPVITFLMALPLGLETVNLKCNGGRAKLLGTVVCVGGATLLTLYRGMPLFDHSHSQSATQIMGHAVKLSSAKKTQRWTIGSVALVIGVLFWSSWFLLQSPIGKRYPCQYSSTAIMSFFGAIQSAILSLSTNRNLSAWVLKGKMEIITVLYAGMIGSGLCYVGMSWCVKKRGPVLTAAFSPLIQILAAMFDIPILHEQLHLGSLLGSIVVIIGLYILLWGKNDELKTCVSKLAQESEEVKEQDQSQMQVIAVSCDSR